MELDLNAVEAESRFQQRVDYKMKLNDFREAFVLKLESVSFLVKNKQKISCKNRQKRLLP